MLESGLVQKLALDRDGKNSGVLSEDELIASRKQYVADDYIGPDIWVFGYGSLIWNPLIAYEEKQFGRVYGFHKRFCLWTRLGRGSPEDPGLVLALDRGGSVRGFVFRIASKRAAQEMDILWQREMINNSYNPKWVSVHTNCGVKKALSFVIRRNSPSYADRMSDENIAEIIDNHADINITDSESGLSLLEYSCKCHKISIIQKLITNPNITVSQIAINSLFPLSFLYVLLTSVCH